MAQSLQPPLEVGDIQAWGAPAAWGYCKVRCLRTSEEGTRSWDPPLCRHCLTPCTPARAGGRRAAGGGSSTLGCPPGEGQPRGRWAGPFATYWCGVSVGLGCRGAGLCWGAPSTRLGPWVLRPGKAPAPAGRSCRASLLTPSASSHPGTLREHEGDTLKPLWVAPSPPLSRGPRGSGAGRAQGCP